MKAFNEWWNKQPVSKYNPGEEFSYEEGWRAALEWVLNKAGIDDYSGKNEKIINKELDDET